MEKIKNAEFKLHVDVECTHCEHDFNLFEIDELTEEGKLHKLLMPDDDRWSDAGKSAHIEVKCPSCGIVILIENIYY